MGPRFLNPIRQIAVATLWCVTAAGFCGLLPASATSVKPPTFDALVNEADYIVHAVARTVQAEKKPTAHGYKIVTRVSFDILETVAGAPPAQLTLELWGGRIGNEAMVIEGMPRFEVGEEGILFVKDNGRSVCPLVAMMHGRYPVARDTGTGRKYVVRHDGRPVRTTVDVMLPLAAHEHQAARTAAAQEALGPAEFIRQIKAAVTPASRVNRAP